MSYATSLLMAYPPPYGPSTLLSDDLVQRSSRGAFYEPSAPYMSSGRLFSDNLVYNPIGFGSTSDHLSRYELFPSTNYRPPSITNWQRDIPGQNSYDSINHVREYSRSLGTASNTNTASSMAHSINENNLNRSTNIFPNYQPSYTRLLNDIDRSPHLTTIWSSTRPKIQINNDKPTPIHHSLPELSTTIVQKKSSSEELKKDTIPISSPPLLTKQEHNLQRNPTLLETEKQQSSVDISVWLTETQDEPSNDEKAAEQAWTDKIDHLHTVQAQREKDKAKLSRALPNITKRVDNKPPITTYNPRITSFQARTGSYFDSLFDGNYFRKNSTNQQQLNSSYQQALSSRNKSTINSFNKSKKTIFPKYLSPRSLPRYKPPSINRVPPNITTASLKKQGPKQTQSDSITPREMIPKDTDERFREALQKFRTDRAEQQQKESNESTAKRLNYGNYVRNSTKDDLLHNVIKPSPWSDFMDMKKGNLYFLTKEEKKDHYNELRSYGERVRYRNFALHNGGETDRIPRRSIAFPVQNQEPQLGDETLHEPVNDNDNDSKSLKRPDSNSTIKITNNTFTKQTMHSDMISNQSGRTTKLTDQSNNTIQASQEYDEVISDFEYSRKPTKRLYDSSVRTTSATDESENDETSEQRST